MEYNKTLQKIKMLMTERDWSLYRLARESGIPYSSLNSLFLKNNQPTISTLEKICRGFSISMSEFFDEQTLYWNCDGRLTNQETTLIEMFRPLNEKDKELILMYMKGYTKTPI